MKTIEEHIQTPVKGEYDVIVAGSGPSGMAAAVNAARLGAKVLVIEAQGSVGGISTTGMMSHFAGSVGNPTFAELLRRMAAKNRFENGVIKRQIDPEMLKIIYLEMLAESGAEVLSVEGGFARVRSDYSGAEAVIPARYCDSARPGHTGVNDWSDALTEVRPGDVLSLLDPLSDGAVYVKKDGISGIYAGRYERI